MRTQSFYLTHRFKYFDFFEFIFISFLINVPSPLEHHPHFFSFPFFFFFFPSLFFFSLLFFFISLFISHTVTDMSVKPVAKPRSSSFNYVYLGLLVLFLPVCIGCVFLYVTCKDKRDDEIALNPKVFVPQLSQI